jgi:hypothetical protein
MFRLSDCSEENVTEIARTRQRHCRRASLATLLSGFVLLFALGIGAIQAYPHEITPILCDGVDDDVGTSSFWALPDDGIKDFSKHQKAFRQVVSDVIGPSSISRLSGATRSPQLVPREQHPPPLKRPPSAERRRSGTSAADPD